ncbi:MAG: ABC transporter transmembrane domain-containing protein, partial [Pseudomonadota bacterium]
MTDVTSAREAEAAQPAQTAEPAAQSGLGIIAKVAPYLWPKDNREAKVRVVIAIIMLVAARAASVSTPFFYKEAVDTLAPAEGTDPAMMLAIGAVGLVVAYGAFRLLSIGFNELRDAIFVHVAQGALRQLARKTFEHIHALSLRYHITRKTGGLSRIIERGVKGVEFLLRFLLFSIAPLALELAMISVVLFLVFDVWYLVVVLVTITLYVTFTFKVTEWRLQIRKRMNDRDTEA